MPTVKRTQGQGPTYASLPSEAATVEATANPATQVSRTKRAWEGTKNCFNYIGKGLTKARKGLWKGVRVIGGGAKTLAVKARLATIVKVLTVPFWILPYLGYKGVKSLRQRSVRIHEEHLASVREKLKVELGITDEATLKNLSEMKVCKGEAHANYTKPQFTKTVLAAYDQALAARRKGKESFISEEILDKALRQEGNQRAHNSHMLSAKEMMSLSHVRASIEKNMHVLLRERLNPFRQEEQKYARQHASQIIYDAFKDTFKFSKELLKKKIKEEFASELKKISEEHAIANLDEKLELAGRQGLLGMGEIAQIREDIAVAQVLQISGNDANKDTASIQEVAIALKLSISEVTAAVAEARNPEQKGLTAEEIAILQQEQTAKLKEIAEKQNQLWKLQEHLEDLFEKENCIRHSFSEVNGRTYTPADLYVFKRQGTLNKHAKVSLKTARNLSQVEESVNAQKKPIDDLRKQIEKDIKEFKSSKCFVVEILKNVEGEQKTLDAHADQLKGKQDLQERARDRIKPSLHSTLSLPKKLKQEDASSAVDSSSDDNSSDSEEDVQTLARRKGLYFGAKPILSRLSLSDEEAEEEEVDLNAVD